MYLKQHTQSNFKNIKRKITWSICSELSFWKMLQSYLKTVVRSKFAGEHPYRSAISIRLQINFIEITLWYVCSPVSLLHIFRSSFPKNTSRELFSWNLSKKTPQLINEKDFSKCCSYVLLTHFRPIFQYFQANFLYPLKMSENLWNVGLKWSNSFHGTSLFLCPLKTSENI